MAATNRSPKGRGPAGAPLGQRESPATRLALLCLLASSVYADPVRVPTAAPVLDVCVGDGIVVAGLGLEGVAWFPADRADAVRARADWPTLSGLSLGDGLFLLCGRDSVVRAAKLDPQTGDFALLTTWASEGIPNEAVAFGENGDHVALACGGGGVSIWEWPDRAQPARLVGRYPFVGFARTVANVRPGVLGVADSHEYGMMTLDIADPLRPRRLGALPMRGYCDDVAWDGASLFFVNRNYGTGQLRPDGDFSTFERVGHFEPLVPDDPDYRATAAVADGDRLFLCELKSGVRVFRRTPEGYRHENTIKDARAAIDVAVVDDGRIAIADFSGAVVVAEIAAEKKRP